jgi:hypothetical protein
MAELVTVRLFIQGSKVQEDAFPLTDAWEPHFKQLVEAHPEMLERLHMFEIEFADGDMFRFGTDPACMVLPIPWSEGIFRGTRSELRFKD